MAYESVTQKLYNQWLTKQKTADLIENKTNDVVQYPLDNNFQSIIRTIADTEPLPLKSTDIKIANLTPGLLMPVGYIYQYAANLNLDKKFFPFIEYDITFNSEKPFTNFIEVETDDWDTNFFRIIQKTDESTVFEGYFNPADNVYELNNPPEYNIIPKKFIDDNQVYMDWKLPAYLCEIEWQSLPTDPEGVQSYKMDPALIVYATVGESLPYYRMNYTPVPYTYTTSISGDCTFGDAPYETTQTLYNGLGHPEPMAADGTWNSFVSSWPKNIVGKNITVSNWVREKTQSIKNYTYPLQTGWITYTQYVGPPFNFCRVVDYGHGVYTTQTAEYIAEDYPAPAKKTMTKSIFDSYSVISVYGVRQKLVGGVWTPEKNLSTQKTTRATYAVPGPQITNFKASELKGYIPSIHHFQEYDPSAGPLSEDPRHSFNTIETYTPLTIKYPKAPNDPLNLNPITDDPNIPLIPTFNELTVAEFTKVYDFTDLTNLIHWGWESCDVYINPSDYPKPISERLGYKPKIICRPPQVSIDPIFISIGNPGDLDANGNPKETWQSNFFSSAMQMLPASKEVTKTVLVWSPGHYNPSDTKVLKSYTPESDTTITAKFTAKIKSPNTFKKTKKYVKD